MRTMMSAWMTVLLLVILAVASGCEDSPITAGEDDQMFLVALPATVRVDPDDPTSPMTSTIVATIVSDTGVPKKGLLVFFSSDGGELASNTQPVSTDASGNAYDTLSVLPGGPGAISVVATSTLLTETVTVTNGACADNAAPTAEFPAVISPAPGLAGETRTVNVTSSSSDPSPGSITSYAWDCGNQTSGGTTATGVCTYVIGATTQIFTIRLTVKDNGLGGAGPNYTCQKSSTITRPVTIAVTPVP